MSLVLAALVMAVVICSTPQSAKAEISQIVTPRRLVGVAFLGGSAVLAQQGFDLNDEADDFYAAYEQATDRAEIEKLYQRTTNRDVKSQVSWALAAAFGATGVRLLLTGSPKQPSSSLAENDRLAPRQASWRRGIRWFPTIEPGRLSLRIERPLY